MHPEHIIKLATEIGYSRYELYLRGHKPRLIYASNDMKIPNIFSRFLSVRNSLNAIKRFVNTVSFSRSNILKLIK